MKIKFKKINTIIWFDSIFYPCEKKVKFSTTKTKFKY